MSMTAEQLGSVITDSVRQATAPLEERLAKIEERAEKDQDVPIVNPNESRWRDTPAPAGVLRHDRENEEFQPGFFIRGLDGEIHWTPDDSEDARGYKPPRCKADLGLRTARVIRAAALARYDAEQVPKIVRDVYRDKDTSELVARALSTTNPSTGGVFVVTPVLVAELIPLLYDFVRTMQLGAREIPMPSGSAHIPFMSTGVAGGWVGEVSEPNAEEATLGQKKLEAKKAYGITAISRDLLEQASTAVDRIFLEDLLRGLAVTMENGAINGLGSEYTPRGIRYDNDCTAVTIGALVTADHPVDFEEALEIAKVDFTGRAMGHLFGPKIKAQMKRLKTSTGDYHFREEMRGGMVEDHPYAVSTLIPIQAGANAKTDWYFGDWKELIYGVTRDLTVEQSTEASYLDASGNRRSAWIQEVLLVKATKKLDVRLRQSKAMARSIDTWTAAS